MAMDDRQTQQLGDFLKSQAGSSRDDDTDVMEDDAEDGVRLPDDDDDDQVVDDEPVVDDDDDDLQQVDDDEDEEEERPKGQGRKEVSDSGGVDAGELAALKAQIAQLQQQVAVKAAATAAAKQEEEEKFELPKLDDIATDAEIEEALNSPKALRALLTKVSNRTYETFMRDTPKLVNRHAQRQVQLATIVTEFKRANADLVGNPDVFSYLQVVANQVEAENPTMAPDQILNTAAERVRKSLNIQKRAKEVNSKAASQGGGKPRFAGKPKGQRRREGTEKLSPEHKQIQAMLKAGR